jgi:hypothetical protein
VLKPLVRVEGLENESQFKKILGWTGSTNAFLGFDRLLDQSTLDGGATLVYQADDWKRFTDASADSRFERAALQPAGGVDRAFQQWLPGDFAPRPDLALFGAAVDNLGKPTAVVSGRDFD